MWLGNCIRRLFAPKTPAQIAGGIGERAAAKFLKKKGLKIAAHNWRCGRYETDIIAFDGDCAVFVEVKTRSQAALVDGYYAALSPRKKSGIRACSRKYLATLPVRPPAWRYDVVDVRLDQNLHVGGIHHFENISL